MRKIESKKDREKKGEVEMRKKENNWHEKTFKYFFRRNVEIKIKILYFPKFRITILAKHLTSYL